MGRLLNEPVLLAAAVRAIIFALMTFGVNVTETQLAAVMGALELTLTLLQRAFLTPNHLAEARVAAGGSPTVPMGKP